MDSQRVHSYRYSKVNQQKKFYLLSLIYKQEITIREHQSQASITSQHTFVFFHKNNHKSYQFDLSKPNTNSNTQTASLTLKKLSSNSQKKAKPLPRIEVVCSIGSMWKRKQLWGGLANVNSNQNRPLFAIRQDMQLEVNSSILVPQAERPKSDWLPKSLIDNFFSRLKGSSCPSILQQVVVKQELDCLQMKKQ